MAAPIIRNKRSSVPRKVPTATDLSFGEFGVNTYDGKVFISASNAVVGVGTTVITVNPWSVGIGSTAYNTYFNAGNVGIATTNPQQKLHVVGNALVSGNLGIGTTNPTSPLHVIGIVTASSYYGDGYNLLRTRQSYQYNNTLVGSATTLNFIGAGVSSVTLLNDIVTVNIPNTIRTTNTYTATLNQTTFSATYNLGFVDVYLNGSKLSSDQYTATTGTNIVLETGASLGDIVDIIGYMTYKVAGTQTILSDTISSISGITTSYTGLADQGSSQSANVWTIRRSIFTSAGILSSSGSAVNAAWINRLSVTYT